MATKKLILDVVGVDLKAAAGCQVNGAAQPGQGTAQFIPGAKAV